MENMAWLEDVGPCLRAGHLYVGPLFMVCFCTMEDDDDDDDFAADSVTGWRM